jgi:hypothetical protein
VRTLSAKLARRLAVGLLGAALAVPVAAAERADTVRGDLKGGAYGRVQKPGVPTVRVVSPRELLLTLYSDFTGRVIIPANARWDLSGFAFIPLRTGVSLVGERGPLGSRPLLFTTNKAEEYPLFQIAGNDVRVEGIHFQGPANGSRDTNQLYVDALRVIEDPVLQTGRRVVIANNEFDEWTHSGVDVLSTNADKLHPEDYPPGLARMRPEDAGLVRIERNYMHHNARDGGGYGVTVSGGAYATIEGNVFDFNRHAVASHGDAYTGYIARFNYVLQGGFKQDSYYNQHFDVHGTALNDEGKNTGYGGTAGEYFEIAFNTIRGEQSYYIVKTRPALMLRGKPTIGAYFNSNVAVHDDLDAAVSLKEDGDTGIGEDHRKFNFHAGGNSFNTDYSTELATGDFDGDGRTDAFVANGTAWFYSRGGSQPWEFLHASNKRTHELGFADIDNDRITDVLYRDDNGNVGTLKSGTFALVPLTTSPVAMRDLRFGDFDGDSRTDIFYTLGGEWTIWYGSTRTWTAVNTSSLLLSQLLFGEFDEVRGTDVAGVANGVWSISRSGTGSWVKINNRLTSSFAAAVAADFDGNGKSDIAFNDGGKWRYSRDGRFPLALLRDGAGDGVYRNVSLKALLIGPFDGGTRAEVVRFNLSEAGPIPLLGERLLIWRGPGSGNAFSMHSLQNMR